MGKRYGRNQRRQHREQIAELNQLTRGLEQARSRDRRIVEETAEVLGRHFMTLAPKTVGIRYLQELSEGLKRPAITRIPDYSADAITLQVDAQEFMDSALPILYTEHDVTDDLRRMERFFVTYHGEVVGYAIDPKHLMLKGRKTVIREMTEALAMQLYKNFEEKGYDRPKH